MPTKIGNVISLKGIRKVAERGTMVTLELTVSAGDGSVPPFFFSTKNMQATFLDNVSDGAVGYANDSGWMQQPEFVRYMRHFIRSKRPTPDSPVL